MAEVDDVLVLSGASSLDDVAARVSGIVDSAVRTGERGRPFIVVGDGVQLTFYDNDDAAGQYIVEVQHAGTSDERRAIATRVYDGLATRTSWALRHESDDAPDGVVAERATRAA
jgi:hypothetical protein